MVGERYHYCSRCERDTTHEAVGSDLRCQDCKHQVCPHDLIEPDGWGHVSCVDCRKSFA